MNTLIDTIQYFLLITAELTVLFLGISTIVAMLLMYMPREKIKKLDVRQRNMGKFHWSGHRGSDSVLFLLNNLLSRSVFLKHDVQSVEPNAFTTEDIELFSTLADQIAIAISNNQLYENTRAALDEAQNLHKRYLNQEWTRKTREPGNTSYKFTPEGLVPYKEDLPDINTVLETARPIFRSTTRKSDHSSQQSVLAVPILLRGEAIGVIHLQENRSEDFEWSENELATVQAVSDQVAQTLENARLFESTVRRAERDRKVLEITSKIRSTNDPQQMLKITLEELKQNLGITDGQIIINLPGGEQKEDRTNTLRPFPSDVD